MNKKSSLLFAFMLLTLSCFSRALQGEVLQYENQVIQQVNLVVHSRAGTVSDTGAIVARLRSQQGGIFSQASFDEDLKTLAQDYDRVDPLVEVIEQQLIVSIHLWPKPVIRTIQWCGNHHVKTKQLQSELGIRCFSLFERQAFNLAFHKLKAYYVRQGFFEAQLDYSVDIDDEANEAIITIHNEEGRSGKIQEIAFMNFTEQEEHEILGEMVTKKYNLFTRPTYYYSAWTCWEIRSDWSLTFPRASPTCSTIRCWATFRRRRRPSSR